MIVKTFVAKTNPREKVPVTVINVKPYHIVMLGRRILCDGGTGTPLVFDTFDLAEICVQDRGLTDCAIHKVELEEIAHICRDRSVPYNSFMLIDKLSQI